MGNILTYLKWRGDLTFTERPFCEVDNLVLSELAYLNLAGIVPAASEDSSIEMEQAAKLFYSQSRSNTCADGPSEDFLNVMASSNRYRKVKLSHFTEELDEQTGTDFCALHIELGDGTVYVAFRGTSDSLLGWREDFSMSFQIMPSQKLAAEYLEETMDRNDVRYRVGGHSKGGNLAVYAAMMLPLEKQDAVMEIYSNDGPGLCPAIVDMERYRAISHKLTCIVPEFSVIGALFENKAPTKIVTSSVSGFLQHDGVTWQIEGDHFCTVESRSAECEYYNHIFDQWIESATMEQRKVFTKDLFDALEAGGAKKRSEIAGSGFDGFEAILLSVIRSEGKTKVVIGKFIKSFFSAFGSVQFAGLFREKKTLQGVALFVLGLFLTALPEFSAQCVGAGIGIAGAVWLGKEQLKYASQQDVPKSKAKMVMNMILMCAAIFLVAQKSLLLHLSNFLMGGIFLFFAYRWAKQGITGSFPLPARAYHILFAAVAFALGVVPIITAGLVMWQYVFSAGIFVMLFGIGQILHSMYENGKRNVRRTNYD